MSRTVDLCGICGSADLKLVLDLGTSPATCNMNSVGSRWHSESHHPLQLLECQDCGLVQLSVIVDPEDVFPTDYPYSSGNSKALHENFEDLVATTPAWVPVWKQRNERDLVVDIGANDGTLLSKFSNRLWRTVGVEPTHQADRMEGPAYQAFFDEALARRIREEHGPAKVITACNVLAHVADIDSVMRGIQLLLAEDGVLVAENHDVASVVEGQWDTVYHEHLRFYSQSSFANLLERYGLAVRRWQFIETHGGSFRSIAEKGTNGINPPPESYGWEGLAQNAAEARRAIRKAAKGVWGVGATARATTVINYCGLDVEDLECICEVSGSDKIGRYVPGTRIPIVDEQRLFDQQPPAVVLFSWHLADSIVPKLRERGYEGEIILPLPASRYDGMGRPFLRNSSRNSSVTFTGVL